MNRFYELLKNNPHFLHGGDYNPDQWQDIKKTVDEDIELMKQAGINCASLGIFSWAQIEKEEGKYDFSWMDYVFDKFEENGMNLFLATPSAAMPAWMAKKYPEVLRTAPDRRRNDFGARVNYCPSSEIYREKCRAIDKQLAKRYGNREPLVLWHVNNEIAGSCYCPKCEERFRLWLKDKYKTLDELNHQWWTGFWSHTYHSWDEVGFPGWINGVLDNTCQGQLLDTKRFSSFIMAEHYIEEVKVLKKYAPDVPATPNTWRIFGEMNFHDFEPYMDIASLDLYPQYHDQPGDYKLSSVYAFCCDYYRNIKAGKPFILMETTPESALMFQGGKLKRPGIHKLVCSQAIAHGADSINYFQWRKGRGCAEQYHGAVVGHEGSSDTKVFRDVQSVSSMMKNLSGILGKEKDSQAAIMYDMESLWAFNAINGVHHTKKFYQSECVAQYRAFYEMGINADVIDPQADFSKYKLLVAPMQYLVSDELADKLKIFVKNGGTLVTTYLSGWTNENALCPENGYPGLLHDLLGIHVEDMDVLDDGEHPLGAWIEEFNFQRKTGTVPVEMLDNPLGIEGVFKGRTMCDQIKLQGAQAIAAYGAEFYKGDPAMTVHSFGKGKAYYIGVRMNDTFNRTFYGALCQALAIEKNIEAEIPDGVIVQERGGYIFIMNFTGENKSLALSCPYTNVETGETIPQNLRLNAYEVIIAQKG